MSVLAVFVLLLIFLCVRLTTIHPPSQDLRGLKLSKLRNFHYLKILTKPLYFVMDILRQLLDPSGLPQRTVSPFRNIPLFFFTLQCLTTGHSISLALYIFF